MLRSDPCPDCGRAYDCGRCSAELRELLEPQADRARVALQRWCFDTWLARQLQSRRLRGIERRRVGVAPDVYLDDVLRRQLSPGAFADLLRALRTGDERAALRLVESYGAEVGCLAALLQELETMLSAEDLLAILSLVAVALNGTGRNQSAREVAARPRRRPPRRIGCVAQRSTARPDSPRGDVLRLSLACHGGRGGAIGAPHEEPLTA